MPTPGYKDVRAEHVVAALEQMEGDIYRLLVVFRALKPDQVLAVSADPSQSQSVTTLSATAAPARIVPLPMLKDNCT